MSLTQTLTVIWFCNSPGCYAKKTQKVAVYPGAERWRAEPPDGWHTVREGSDVECHYCEQHRVQVSSLAEDDD